MNTDEIAAAVSGAVLAGGNSTRMGRPKALLPWKDSTFLATVVGVLESVFHRVAIVSDDSSVSAGAGNPVHADIHKGQGPLGGIHSALAHAETAMVFICSTDMPLVSAEDVHAVLSMARPETITIAAEGDRWHPLFGVYPKSILPELEAALREGRRRMRDVILNCSCGHTLCPMDISIGRLVNINTPDEYADLLRDTPLH